jgi:hypothetical protein
MPNSGQNRHVESIQQPKNCSPSIWKPAFGAHMARRIYNGTPDNERDEKKKHLAKILAVAEATSVTKETVSEICQKSADLPKSDEALASHATDFEPMFYNMTSSSAARPKLRAKSPDFLPVFLNPAARSP